MVPFPSSFPDSHSSVVVVRASTVQKSGCHGMEIIVRGRKNISLSAAKKTERDGWLDHLNQQVEVRISFHFFSF